MPVFENRKNPQFKSAEGGTYFISRSVAVVLIPVFRTPDQSLSIPVGIRSQSTPDHQGKLGLVCGYLDWEESGWTAARREAWEEIGLDLDPYLFGKDEEIQPYFVQSNPAEDERQNVTLRYRLMIDVQDLPVLRSSEEVDAAQWINFSAVQRQDFAFNHRALLLSAFEEAPVSRFAHATNAPPIVF